MTCFASLSEQSIRQIGGLAEVLGKRPSEFFEWNAEDEWEERLLFDTYVMGEYCRLRDNDAKR